MIVRPQAPLGSADLGIGEAIKMRIIDGIRRRLVLEVRRGALIKERLGVGIDEVKLGPEVQTLTSGRLSRASTSAQTTAQTTVGRLLQ